MGTSASIGGTELGSSLTRKILESHVVEGRWAVGEEIGASITRRRGISSSRPGNGVCHRVHLGCFGRPGPAGRDAIRLRTTERETAL